MVPKPRLAPTCGRCGKPRTGLRHICFSNSKRRATPKLKLSFGKCPSCGKTYGSNPLTHVCKPKSDFKQRRKAAERAARKKEQHDYQTCQDGDCKRTGCVAYKTGMNHGYGYGHDDGFRAGFIAGGRAAQ